MKRIVILIILVEFGAMRSPLLGVSVLARLFGLVTEFSYQHI